MQDAFEEFAASRQICQDAGEIGETHAGYFAELSGNDTAQQSTLAQASIFLEGRDD